MSNSESIDLDILQMIIAIAKGMKKNGFNEQDITFKLRKKFEDIEIQAALEELRASHTTETDQTTSLQEENSYYGWYDGPNEKAGAHWPSLKQTLKQRENSWTDEMIHSLDMASTTVVSHLAPPRSENRINVKGLVLGYIQSGKTANFSATIAKAVDEGYKLVVVLAGMHNNLRMQTELRLRSELVDPLDGKTCTTLTDVDDKGDFKRKQPVKANSQLSRKEGFVLVVLKKNSTVLRNFNSWLDEASDDVLKNCPTLVIDDESDQASINTNKVDQDPTAINNHIRKLIQRFHVVSYVGYTATPFANVFIDADVKEDIYPKDFLVTLDKPKTYYGPEELFGRNEVNGKESSEGFPVIRRVPEDEADLLRSNAKSEETLDILPSTLTSAIDSFLLGGSIRLCRGQWKQHITMLVHVSHLTDSHSSTISAIEQYVDDLKFDLENENEELKSNLYNLWRNDFAPTTKSIIERCDHEFEKVWKNAYKFINKLEVIMDNSNSSERLTFDRSVREGEPLWGIIVGGNTLSRGLTLEGLTTSYFVRNSKAYDTLLQMGRWFGYRKGYVDVTRIFVPDELYLNFYELATIEQEIRDEIRVMASNRERPIDVALRIRKIPNMLITASNKARNIETTTLTYSGTKIQTHQIVVSDIESITRNENSVVSLLKQAQTHSKKENIPFKDLSSCHLFRNLSPELILQFLDQLTVSENNAKFDKKLIQGYISDLYSSNELTDWSLSLMSLKSGDTLKFAGLTVHPVKRNVKHEAGLESGHIEATLRAVSTPGEEIIDLFDAIGGSFNSTDEILEPKNGEKKSDTKARKEFRPKNRGLLMIYPLQSNTGMSAEEYSNSRQQPLTSYPLHGAGQLFAISIVFPFSSNHDRSGTYHKNYTVKG